MTFDTLLKAALLSLRTPRDGLRIVFGWRLSMQDGVIALVLAGVLSALFGSLVIQVPPEIDPVSRAMLTNPLYLAVTQVVGLGLIALCIHGLGLVFKGRGTLDQAVVMIAWVQMLWVAILVVEIVALLLFPPLGMIVLVVGMVFSLRLLVGFTAELHGFQSWFLTLLGVIAAFFAAMLAAVFVLFFALLLGVMHV